MHEKQTLSLLNSKRVLFFLLHTSVDSLWKGDGYLRRSHLLFDDERFPHDTTINVLDVVSGSLEMTRRIITLGDIAFILCSVFKGDIEIRHRHKPEISLIFTGAAVLV